MPYKNLEDKRRHDRAYDLAHREEKIERAKRWNRANREKILGHSYLHILEGMESRHLEKVKAIMHYSNPVGAIVCNNCGEQDIDILCLDHIDGNGSLHRKKLNLGGSRFYQWLRRNAYPTGLQVLCANCNMKKARFERKKASLERG